MSLSRPESNPSNKKRYYIGKHPPEVTIIKDEYMHWTEQVKMKPKDTTPRPYRETGDFNTLMDIDRD